MTVAMAAGSVSPTERDVSALPRKAMSVLWLCALNRRSVSVCESKSTSKMTSLLKSDDLARSSMTGFCALQVGHQGAVTWTRMGRPRRLRLFEGLEVERLMGRGEGRTDGRAHQQSRGKLNKSSAFHEKSLRHSFSFYDAQGRHLDQHLRKLLG
jgi:hypothetical protein